MLSFIKLDINILDDAKIKFILKMPGGDILFRLWIGMLCLAMKSGKPGILEIGDGIAFTPDMLSNHFDIERNTISLALTTFEKMKMIEIWNNGTIYITNFEKHQNLDKIEVLREQNRLRVQRHREKNKLLADGQSVMHYAITSNATDLDLDLDLDKDLRKNDAHFLTDFDWFWENYQKKKDRKKCLNKFKKLKRSEIDSIKEHLPKYIESTPNIQYRKNPLTYLNGNCWEDENIVPNKFPLINKNNTNDIFTMRTM